MAQPTSLASVTFSSAAASMGGVALMNAVAASGAPAGGKGRVSNGFATVVNSVAFFHYLYMRSRRARGYTNITSIRYSDWFITTPLMLAEIGSLWGAKSSTPAFAVAVMANMLMLGFGYKAEQVRVAGGAWQPYWASGAGFLLVLFGAMSKQYADAEEGEKEEKRVGMSFLAVWALYGLAFLLEGEARQTAYNVLDIVSKGGLGAYVGVRALEDSTVPCTQVCHPDLPRA